MDDQLIPPDQGLSKDMSLIQSTASAIEVENVTHYASESVILSLDNSTVLIPGNLAILNKGPADFEGLRNNQQTSALIITQSPTIGLLLQDQSYPFTETTSVGQLCEVSEGLQSRASLFSEELLGEFDHTGGVLEDQILKFQALPVEVTQSYNSNNPIDSNRQVDVMDVVQPPEIAITPTSVIENIGQFTASSLQSNNYWNSNNVYSNSNNLLLTSQPFMAPEKFQQSQQDVGIELDKKFGIPNQLGGEASLQVQQNLKAGIPAVPAVARDDSFTAPVSLVSSKEESDAKLIADMKAFFEDFYQNEFDSSTDNTKYHSAIQNQNPKLCYQSAFLEPDIPAECLQRNQYVQADIVNNQPQISKELETNPMQAETPIVSQASKKRVAPGSETGKKSQRKYEGNGSSETPVTEEARHAVEGAQSDSPHTNTPTTAALRRENNSPSKEGGSYKLSNQNTDNPTTNNLPMNPAQELQQSQPADNSTMSQEALQINRVANPPPFVYRPDPVLVDKCMRELSEMVVGEDDIIEKFKPYEKKYGTTLHGFYMGDNRCLNTRELKSTITEEDHAEMNNMGNSLHGFAESIAGTLLKMIMHMTEAQAAPIYEPLMHFSQSACLGPQLLSDERVAHARSIVRLVANEQYKWGAPTGNVEDGGSAAN
ncbi:hypothetical protein C7212DRAFT_366983 [Tuber magnatum]|uniref:Uncharacterized protein n=1 Tax=Tuber magnatum TaxID=42249 RepID=A0A317SBH2_9PEZI|nr:hypothetical protein C7212DRAFT_366983 [Tuber magnatum]